MIARELELSELIEERKLWSICFMTEMNVEEAMKKEPAKAPEDTHYGCFLDSGEMAAAMVVHHFKMQFDGEWTDLAGIGGVVTHPAYRRGGAIRQTMEKVLRTERENGVVFSSLKPFSHVFYRKFGYELAQVRRCFTFPPAAFAQFNGPMEVKLLQPEDDCTLLTPVYEAFAHRYNLSIARNAGNMKRYTHSEPYAKNMFTYAIYEKDECLAYVAFAPIKRGEDTHMNVRDYAFSSLQGFRKILGFLSRMNAQYKMIEMQFPGDLPLHSLVDAPYESSCREISDYMIRVVDVQKALAKMKREGNYRLVIGIKDEFLPENGGNWLATPGKCEKTEEAPDVEMTVQTFGQMITGYLSFDEACCKADVKVNGKENELRRIFPKKAVYTGVSF